MKDTVITARRKKRELITLLICFIIANLVNLYAIFAYDTSVKELFTSLGYVIVLALFLYGIWCLVRLAFYALKMGFRKKSLFKTGLPCLFSFYIKN
ncbi:MAG: hypothetical protein LUE93_09045 [Bacteroides sp.]|nr:hypothetical protein [Bacteroides sp.]